MVKEEKQKMRGKDEKRGEMSDMKGNKRTRNQVNKGKAREREDDRGETWDYREE